MLDNFVMMDTWLQSLQVMCQLEEAKIANYIRDRRGEAPAYSEEHFAGLDGWLETLRERIS